MAEHATCPICSTLLARSTPAAPTYRCDSCRALFTRGDDVTVAPYGLVRTWSRTLIEQAEPERMAGLRELAAQKP